MTRRLPDGRQESFQLRVETGALAPDAPLALEALRFQMPDPEHLSVFGKPLRSYLEATGHGWVVRLYGLLAEVDQSALVANYGVSGQPPLHPRLVLGLMVYGFLVGRTSLRELEALAELDLGAMYMAGGLQPDHSTLGKYMVRHQAVLTEEYFLTLTGTLLARLGTRAGPAAGDGTVMEAAASRFRIVKAEALKEAAQQAAEAAKSAPSDEAVQARAHQAAALAEVAQQRQDARRKCLGDACLATTEPEAVVQPRKDGAYRPAYKPVVLANADRMIVGQDLQPSNENAALPRLLDQHRRLFGEDPTQLMLDAGFFVAMVLKLCGLRGLDVLVASGRGEKGEGRKQRDAVPKEDFRFDPETDTYRCPKGRLLVLDCVSNGQEPYRRYRCHDCEGCELRPRCTRDAEGRTIKRYAEDDLKAAARQVMQHPQAQKAYRRRKAIVEPVFSELRSCQRLTRFRRNGRAKVAAEFALHCIAYNLKRTLLLLARKAAGPGRSRRNPRRGASGAPGALLRMERAWADIRLLGASAAMLVECARADIRMLEASAANDPPGPQDAMDDVGMAAA